VIPLAGKEGGNEERSFDMPEVGFWELALVFGEEKMWYVSIEDAAA